MFLRRPSYCQRCLTPQVLEQFVMVTTTLPMALKRHLKEIRDSCLEHYAWAKDSPLFRLIDAQKERNAWPVQSLKEEESSDGALLPPSAAAGGGGSSSGGGGDGGTSVAMDVESSGGAADSDAVDQASRDAEQVRDSTLSRHEIKGLVSQSIVLLHQAHPVAKNLEHFFRKLLQRVCILTFELCEHLQLDDTIRNHVWTTMKHLIHEHPDLLQSRHIHQLILCTLYGVCKVNKRRPEVLFTQIISTYKEIGHHCNSLVHHIILHSETDRGDIIKFYNKIYIPIMKAWLTRLTPDSKNKAPISVMPLPRLRQARIGPVTVSNAGMGVSWFASPAVHLRGASSDLGGFGRSPMPHMTPRTKVLYAFGESSSKDLEVINHAVAPGGTKRFHSTSSILSSAPVLEIGEEGQEDAQRKRRRT